MADTDMSHPTWRVDARHPDLAALFYRGKCAGETVKKLGDILYWSYLYDGDVEVMVDNLYWTADRLCSDLYDENADMCSIQGKILRRVERMFHLLELADAALTAYNLADSGEDWLDAEELHKAFCKERDEASYAKQ